jgi:hypothetical protein
MFKTLKKSDSVKTSQKRGFTVMENIMAFSILTLSLAGFSGMAVTSLKSFRMSQDKYIAAKIAQEGIELATNKKVNHMECVTGNPGCPITTWQQNLLGDFMPESADTTDLLPANSFPAFNSTKKICIIRVPPKDTGKFGYCDGIGTIGVDYPQNFRREVKITAVNSYSVLAQSIVTWNTNGTAKSLKLESILFGQ